MATIMPQGELMRKAVKWVCEYRNTSDVSLDAALEQAAMNFNLGPKDAEFLGKFMRDNPEGEETPE